MSYLIYAAVELLNEAGLGSAVSEEDGVVSFVEPNIGITQEQIAAKAAQMQAEKVFDWQQLRADRDQLIAETDWWATSDRTMTAEETAYRQALRDLPANTADPANPVWPTKP